MKYTEQEVEYLQVNYCKEDKPTILEKLKGHTWCSIKEKSKKLNLSRPNIRTSKLKILLENNLKNAYWWGFIMSDGYISKKGDLKISLNIKDEVHLNQLSTYINCSTNHISNLCTLEVMDKINGLSLKNKLKIVNKKTYNPPVSFDFLKTKEERLSFLIGFIDGDGSIQFRKNSFQSIRIVIHENWFNFFEEFCKQLGQDYNLKFTISKNQRKNSCVYIGKLTNYKFLLKFIIDNDIPKMIRKWKNVK